MGAVPGLSPVRATKKQATLLENKAKYPASRCIAKTKKSLLDFGQALFGLIGECCKKHDHFLRV
jgi:hypothetical protein